MKKSVVLLSAGLDSTVNLVESIRQHDVKLAVTFDYGQRAASREIERAKQICDRYKVAHTVVDLPWLQNITATALVDRRQKVPVGGQLAIDDLQTSHKSARAVWVPNRNGVFLNIAASFAESIGADYVVPGFNAEEAATFPDNSADFLRALDHSFGYSTLKKVVTVCFTQDMNKIEIAQRGRALGAPFELMWPCYFGGAELCGECESCLRFRRACQEADR